MQLGGSDPEKVYQAERKFCSDFTSVCIQIQLCEENTCSSFTVAVWFEAEVFLQFRFLRWLALGWSEFAAEVLRRRVQQPVGVHQTQVPHVAAGGVQQLVEDDVRWLGLEKDGGRVDGHRLVGVQS